MLRNFDTLRTRNSLFYFGTHTLNGSLVNRNTLTYLGSLASLGTHTLRGPLRRFGTHTLLGSLATSGTLVRCGSLFSIGTLNCHGSRLCTHNTVRSASRGLAFVHTFIYFRDMTKIAKNATEKFRLSSDEKDALRRAAKHAGVSISAYIRKSLMATIGAQRRRARTRIVGRQSRLRH